MKPKVIFRKVGRPYSTWYYRKKKRWYQLFEYPCTVTFADVPKGGTCCHRSCRLEALRAAGYADVAERLDRNGEAIDWKNNWGKLVYDPRDHGRDSKRRRLMAEIIKAMRRRQIGYATACGTGAWLGAMVT